MKEKRNLFQLIVWALEKFGEFICNIGSWLKKNWRISFELRKVVMAVPVLGGMFLLVNECRQRLPEVVGINLLESGQFEQLIPRELAVTVCMGVTIACLVLMFCSRKTILPWMVSILSLVLPIMLILVNTFPV